MVIGKMTREIISFISLLVYFVAANAMCVSDSDCKMQFPGHIMRCIGNTCEKGVGGTCKVDNDCAIKNSVCEPNTNTCQCKPEYQNFDEERSSVCAKALATECAVNEDCFTNATCTENLCNCDAQQGFIPTKDSRRCLHKSSSYNSTCTTAQTCPNWGDGTNCADGFCVCQSAYHFYEDKCYYTLKLKATCGNDEKRRCYLPDDGKDQHVICNTNTKTCECERGYKPSDDEKKCKIKPFDGTCYTNDDCTYVYGKHAECSHNKCKCKEEHHLYNNTCCFNLVLGNQCDINGLNDHCYLPLDGDKQHVECGSSGKCQCSHGFKPDKTNQQCISGSPTMWSAPAFIFSAFIVLKVAL